MTPHKILQLILISWLAIVATHSLMYRDQWPRIEPRDDLVLTGTVHEVVSRSGKSQTVRVGSEYPGRVQVTAGSYPELVVGDVVSVECDLVPIEEVYVEEFRYDRYLAKENVFAVCQSWGEARILDHEDTWRSRIFQVRDGFEAVMQRHLPEPHSSLLAGLLYGARSTMPDEIQEQFRRTGTMHIVAVSGYNVMLVVEMLMFILTVTLLKRQHAFWFVLAGVITFVIMAGGDPAVVRAGIMGSVVLIAKQVGRLQRTVTLFLFAAVIMTLVNPRVLLDDVGFQLSFCAAIGLVTIGPKLAKKLVFIPEWKGLRSTLAETLAAITATFPIMFLQFKQFSIVAPIANLLVVPWIALTMTLGFMSTLASWFLELVGLGSYASYIMLPTYALLELMLTIIELLSPLPFIDFS